MKVELKKIKETKFPSHCLSLVLGDDEKVYASCYDGGVYCLDGAEKKPKKIVTHENISSGVKLCGDNIISSDYDGIIKWSDLKSHNELRKIKGTVDGTSGMLPVLRGIYHIRIEYPDETKSQ